MEAEPGQGGAPQQQPKTKEQALEACVEDHRAYKAQQHELLLENSIMGLIGPWMRT